MGPDSYGPTLGASHPARWLCLLAQRLWKPIAGPYSKELMVCCTLTMPTTNASSSARHAVADVPTRIVFAALFALLALASCTPWQTKVTRHVQDQQFAEASGLLTANGAGATPAADLDAEGKAARAAFTTAIETTTAAEVFGRLDAGSAHDALALCEERIRLCPWSATLPEYRRDCEAKVAQIRAAEQAWLELLTSTPPTREALRSTLTDAVARPSWYFDSPILPSLLHAMQNLLADAGFAQLEASQFRLSTTEATDLAKDLRLARVDLEQEQLLVALQDLLRALPVYQGKRPSVLTSAELQALGAARQLAESHGAKLAPRCAPSEDTKGSAAAFVADAANDPRLTRLQLMLANAGTRTVTESLDASLAGCWEAIGSWATTNLGAVLTDAEVGSAALAEGETWADPSLLGDLLHEPLARAHVRTAARIANDGTACHLAMLHLARARRLGLAVSDPAYREATAAAKETRLLSPRVVVRAALDDERTFHPDCESPPLDEFAEAFSVALAAFRPALTVVVGHAKDAPDLMVLFRVTKADEYREEVDTKVVHSSYQDGMREVVNPEKKSMWNELAWARGKVVDARQLYEMSLQQYRENPSPWKRTQVEEEAAYHNRCIDEYEALQTRFDALPDTIVEPNLVPYTFTQGTIRGGIRLTMAARFSGGREQTYSHEVSAPFPYQSGNKSSDVNPAYRNENHMKVLMSEIHSRDSRLEMALAAVVQKMNFDLGRLPFATTVELSPEQKVILSWLLHPRGIQKDIAEPLGVPAWAIEATDVEELTSQGK